VRLPNGPERGPDEIVLQHQVTVVREAYEEIAVVVEGLAIINPAARLRTSREVAVLSRRTSIVEILKSRSLMPRILPILVHSFNY
jgi:hypothetical protein